MQRHAVIALVLVSGIARGDPPKMKTGACAGKTFVECSRAALDFEYGAHGVKLNKQQAAAMYQAACDAGDLGSCTSRAGMGEHSGLDEVAIRKLFERGCSSGVANDCALYAYHLTDADEPADIAKGYALLEKLCLQGQGGACNSVADHSNGATAVKWQRKSCEAKEGGDCTRIDRTLYRDGDPALTPAQTTRELESRCNTGDDAACSWAGARHFEGKGAKPSRADSDVWMGKACDLGVARECIALGRRALFDRKPDKARAKVFFQKACVLKDPDGCDWANRAER